MSAGWKLKEIHSIRELLRKPNKFKEELHKPYSFGPLWVYVYKENFKLIKRMCGGLRDKRVVDVGCGGGWLSEWLSREGTLVYGLDISPDFCKLAKVRSKLHGFNCEIICGDGEKLPFKDSAFDMVIIYATMHHFPSFENGLNEALRLASKVVLADEPCRIPGFDFLIVKILRDRIFKRREYSGIDGHRFDLKMLKKMLLSSGNAITFRRIWSYVPPGLEKRGAFTCMAYKIAHKVLMNLFKPLGHAFIMVIERSHAHACIREGL